MAVTKGSSSKKKEEKLITYKFKGKTFELKELKGQKDIFFSYKSENAAFVRRLYEEFKTHDIKSWFDKNELHYYAGDKYTDRIHAGIDSAPLFLLIYTKGVENSDFIIEEELEYAIQKKKTILFFPKDEIDLNTSKLKEYIGKIQWLDTKASAVDQIDTQESIKDEKYLKELSSYVNEKHGEAVFEDESLFLIRIRIQQLLEKITIFGNYKKLCGVSRDDFYEDGLFDLKVINKALFIDVPAKYYEALDKKNFFRKDKNHLMEVQKHLNKYKPDNEELINRFKKFLEDNGKIYGLPVLYERLKEYLKMDKYEGVDFPDFQSFNIDSFITVVSEMVACSFVADLYADKTFFNGAELGVYSIEDNRTVNNEEHCVDMQLYYSDYFTFKCMTEMYHILCSIDDEPLKIDSTTDVRPLAPFLCSLGLGGFVAAYIKNKPWLLWTKRGDKISAGNRWHFSYDETVSLYYDGVKDKNGHLIVDKDKSVKIDTDSLLKRALREEVGITEANLERHHGLFEVGIIKSERLEIELISQALVHLKPTPSPQEQLKEMHDSSEDGYLEIAKMEFLPLRERKSLIGRLLTPESYHIFIRMQDRVFDNIGRDVKPGKRNLIEDGGFIDDGAELGNDCNIHRNVYIGKNVKIGNKVKIQNNNSIYEGVTLEDGVFIGTNVSFINDKYPRSILRDGRKVTSSNWKMGKIRVCYGASIGAGAVIMCGSDKKELKIGKWAMVAAGSVVLEDVPDGAMVAGNPARVIKKKIDY